MSICQVCCLVSIISGPCNHLAREAYYLFLKDESVRTQNILTTVSPHRDGKDCWDLNLVPTGLPLKPRHQSAYAQSAPQL